MINLLPPTYKQELRQEEHFRIFMTLGLVCVAGLICLVLLLVAIRVYVNGAITLQEAQQESLLQQKSETERIQQQIQKENANVRAITSFYRTTPSTHAVFEEIEGELPEDVYLTSLAYLYSKNADGMSVSLGGIAATIQSVERLQENLKGNPAFQDVKIPTSVWFPPSPGNVQFNLDVTILVSEIDTLL